MFLVTTYETESPFTRLRTSSAAAHTAANASTRAPKSDTISSALKSQPLTARSNIRTNPSPAGAGQAHKSRRRDGDSICTCGIEICAPGAQSSVLAKPWLSIEARIWDRMAESAHFCASRAKEG